MKENIVAIIGRPNVGKSSLFNVIAKSKISIVDDKPGVTRDRIYANCNWLNYNFKLIDTGGLEDNLSEFSNQMKEQVLIAIKNATVLILVVDVKTGLTDLDKEVSSLIRKYNKNVIVCVNKVDNYKKTSDYIYEFYELGFSDVYPVSCVNRQGIGDLLDKVVSYFNDENVNLENEDIIKIAIIGRPNAGKSSLLNKLLGEERVIVSNIPGTTRDAIDTEILYNEKKYLFIDTAGIRRKSKFNDNIEIFSNFRTEIAIDRCDIAIIMIDAYEDISNIDTYIAGIADKKGKGIIIAINKWDLILKDDKTMNKFQNNIKEKFAFIPFAKTIFISAKTGQRVNKLFDLIEEIHKNQTLRLKSGVINEVLLEAVANQNVPQDKGKPLKIYYATQTTIKPPTFILFINKKELFHFSYLRYIENKFREAFDFGGTPINFILREKREE